MIYKISNKQKKTWQDKEFTQADLIGEDGTAYEKVAAWKNEFEGDTFEGDLEKNDKGYWRIVPRNSGRAVGFKSAQIEKVMDRKEQSIGKTMDRKEESIALAGAQRDAVLIVTEIGRVVGLQDEDIKSEIIKWRNWFLSDDFKEHPPF